MSAGVSRETEHIDARVRAPTFKAVCDTRRLAFAARTRTGQVLIRSGVGRENEPVAAPRHT